MNKKKFTFEVTRKVTTVETTNISVEANNATEGKGIVKYKAENDIYEWTQGKDEAEVISAKIVGVDSRA